MPAILTESLPSTTGRTDEWGDGRPLAVPLRPRLNGRAERDERLVRERAARELERRREAVLAEAVRDDERGLADEVARPG